MAQTLRDRKDMNPAYMWDLSPLFADDGAWEKAFGQIDGYIAEAAAFQGKLKDAASIRAFFEAETALGLELSDLFCYASMRRSEDMRADDAQRMYQKAFGAYVKASAATAFAVPEILKLPEETLKEIADSDLLSDYRYPMEKIIRRKPHTLTAAEEQIIARFGEVLSAPKTIAENLMDADLVFDPAVDGEGKQVEVTGSNYILLQSSPDRALRKSAFESFYEGYRRHINTFAASYAGCVRAAVTEASLRHYRSSREMMASEESVPTEVCDNLIEAVHRGMPLMHRYAELRKRILGVDELHYYDLYAPLAKNMEKSYTYEQAQQMVLEAVTPLGEHYQELVRKGFSEHWIDVYPNRGKQGGAYSESTYRSNPYIMANFTGTLDSVSTIAHEMGHSIHSWLSNHAQKPQTAEYSIFVAEVASTVNENLLAEQLLQKAQTPEEKLYILNQYLEGFKGTVYRQTMFAEFEEKAHAAAEQGGDLSAASLNGIYRELVGDYFGPALVMDDEVQYEWARIPHFYRPFYVYKYATSYSAAVAISEAILREFRESGRPGEAAEKYLKFLSLGGSMDPLDELKTAGVDFSSPAPVDRALEKFGKVLDETEALFR